jgi:hypothetical protein
MANCGQLPIGGCWLPIDHDGKCINPEVAERVLDHLPQRRVQCVGCGITWPSHPDFLNHLAAIERHRDLDGPWFRSVVHECCTRPAEIADGIKSLRDRGTYIPVRRGQNGVYDALVDAENIARGETCARCLYWINERTHANGDCLLPMRTDALVLPYNVERAALERLT